MSSKVFVFGQQQSGKSTLCAAICHYVATQKEWGLRFNLGNPEGLKYLREEWLRPLRRGQFPEKTNPGNVLRVDMGYEAPSGKSGILTLFEVAGETVRQIDPTRPDHSDCPPDVKSSMLEADVFILVGSADATVDKEDDLLHMTFLETLLWHDINRPILFVLAKADLVGFEEVETTVLNNYRIVLRHLRNHYRRNSEVLGFSIGKVSEDKSSIVQFRPDYGVEKVIAWIASYT